MPESLKIACPKCKTVMQVQGDARGKKVKCPQCAAVIAVPAAKTSPRPAPAPTPAAKADPAATSAATRAVPPASTVPLQPHGDDDEWGIIESYQVERTDDKPRCPFCAHDLEDDQTLCLHCGYDLIRRDRHNQKILHATRKEDYFIWWLPAIGCLIVVGICVTLIIMMITATPDFGGSMDWLQRKPQVPDHPKWGYVYGCVVLGAIIFLCGRFAVVRLVMNPHPPDKEKHMHKKDEE